MNADKHRLNFGLWSLIFGLCLWSSACSLLTSIPSNIKDFLASADEIEITVFAEKGKEKFIFDGDVENKRNWKAMISDEATKSKILNAFYNDAVGSGEAACFIPRHFLKATKGNQIVEIEICYECFRYEGKGSLGEFRGGVNFTNSQEVLNQIVFDKGIEVKE